MNNNIVEFLNSRNKVELSAQVVELALTDDLKAAISAVDSEQKNFDTFKSEFDKVKRAGIVNSKQASATIKMLAKLLDDFNAKAKDLGVDASSVSEFKDLRKKFSDLNGIIAEYNTTYK